MAYRSAQAYNRLSVRIVGGFRFLGQHASGGGVAGSSLKMTQILETLPVAESLTVVLNLATLPGR